MAGGPLSQLYYKGVSEGREQGIDETLLKVYLNCRSKGIFQRLIKI